MDITEFKTLSNTIKNEIRIKIIEHYKKNTWIINVKHELYQNRDYRHNIQNHFANTIDCHGNIYI